MELIRYLLNNILKRPMRFFFIAAAGFLSSLVLVFAFAVGVRVTKHLKTDTIAKWTGHLWISAAEGFTFKEDLIDSYGRQAQAVAAYLAQSGPGTVAVEWLSSYSEMQAGTVREFVQVQATDFTLDVPYRNGIEFTDGGFPGDGEEYGVIISSRLADKYSLAVDDAITLFIPSAFGARNAMDFTVTGIFRPTSPWYNLTVCIRSADYLSMAELEGISPFYKVYVDDEKRIESMVDDLQAIAPDFRVKGYRDDEFVSFILSLGTSDIALFGTMAMIIFLALLIGINSVVMTNIFDRRDEIGTLRALGFSRSVVRNLFFGESIAALAAGYLAGAAAIACLGRYWDAVVVRPPLLMLEYTFGMTRMAMEISPLTLSAPFLALAALFFLGTYRMIGAETEKQAVAQMANR